MRGAAILLVALCHLNAWGDSTCPSAQVAASNFERAQTAAWSGEHEQALRLLGELIACSQDNADYHFLHAQTLHWSGDDSGARAALATTLQLAPSYQSALDLEHRLERERLADAAVALDESGPAASADPPLARTAAIDQPAQDSDRGAWIASSTLGVSTLSGGREGWQQQSVTLAREREEDLIGVSVQREVRASTSNTGLGIFYERALTATLRLNTRIGFTADAAFLPRQFWQMGIEKSLPEQWVANASISQRNFASADTRMLSLGVQRYFARYRVAWQSNIAQLESAGSSISHSLSADYYQTDNTRLRLTIAGGRELEALANDAVLESRVAAIVFDISHQIDNRWRIGGFVGYHKQHTFYERRYAGLTVSARY